jgi:hypothetical protein
VVHVVRNVLRWLSVVVILAVLAGLAFLVIRDDRGERLTAGRRPSQFYRALGDDVVDDYAGALGVAHNAGDDLAQIVDVLSYGADAIEVDVVSLSGRLAAAHDEPLPVVGQVVFRGPSLEQSWSAGQAAGALLLDLKQTDAAFVAAVVRFLDGHMTTRDGDGAGDRRGVAQCARAERCSRGAAGRVLGRASRTVTSSTSSGLTSGGSTPSTGSVSRSRSCLTRWRSGPKTRACCSPRGWSTTALVSPR